MNLICPTSVHHPCIYSYLSCLALLREAAFAVQCHPFGGFKIEY